MTDGTDTMSRRAVMQTAAGLAVAAAAAPAPASALPPLPATGKPGDFDFLTGEWRIANRMISEGKWIEFPGEATVVRILDGVGSVEELRIPARKFSGMGLRLLDVEKKIWNDHWVNAKSGVVSVPGKQGVFANGVGTFLSEDADAKPAMLYRGVWDRITPNSCRWFQGGSNDGGKTWTDTWFMDWRRA
jgi:hypothetical protein